MLAHQEWEADQAQEKAFELHSDQMEASNRCFLSKLPC